MKLRKIISGGQSGVDLAALVVAKSLGYETGGYMPRGFLTEDGPKPEYAALYGMVELPTGDYPTRTRKNVEKADATLVLTVGLPTGGTALTVRACERPWRPHAVVDLSRGDAADLAEVVREMLEKLGVETLNVAGPRESKNPGVYEKAKAFLQEVLKP